MQGVFFAPDATAYRVWYGQSFGRMPVCREAPGAEEDRRGLPFVGRAGQLLNAMILALGLERDQTYIANVLKCRPPDNRDPLGEEVRSCETYLHRQIELLEPRIIIALGRFAAQSLLKSSLPIGKLRGQCHSYEPFGIPLVATYHPRIYFDPHWKSVRSGATYDSQKPCYLEGNGVESRYWNRRI